MSEFPMVIILTSSLFSAVTVLAGLLIIRSRPNASRAQNIGDNISAAIFLFKNGKLIDANVRARECASPLNIADFVWSDLHNLLGARFPGFPKLQGVDENSETVVLPARDPSDLAVVTISQSDGSAKVSLKFKRGEAPLVHDLKWQAGFDAPNPIWQTDETGRVTWSNAAYELLAAQFRSQDEEIDKPILDAQSTANTNEPARVGVSDKNASKVFWFDVVNVHSQNRTMHYATDASAIVDAEIAQRNFVQTLTKTFAHLSIGLAIFDRNRQLALFNPALIDLTSLPADFLSGRPNLFAFFDHMRDKQVMPEPKNYASWRA
ncbi:hypothetical protein [Shimia abyssi]|uniref:PAS domain-containing protein n=1 Tax=Shimia abyssi TaxID=1662395 RepID=A0A2P8F8A2_9RHOB|nr:hypothetical protein [Shimia abyssi]PSL17939.1 hypothetical protein CLV88_11310 [Shimia abyssi]